MLTLAFQQGWAASVKIEFVSKYSSLPIDWVMPFSPRAGTSNGPFILGVFSVFAVFLRYVFFDFIPYRF